MSETASSSSSVEHCLQDMMLTDLDDKGEAKDASEKDDAAEDGTTPQFAKLSACRSTTARSTSTCTTEPTQKKLPTHFATALNNNESTVYDTLKRIEAISPTKHANDTLSSPASFIALVKEEASQSRTSHAQTSTEVWLGDNREAESDNEIVEDQDSAKQNDKNLKPPGLSQNNSSESFQKMSVSTTPSSPPDDNITSKKKPRKTIKNKPKDGQSTGRWTDEEHQSFLRGLHTYGREWKKVASHIPTRSSAQVRSHAQKYFAKLQKDEDSWTGSYTAVEGVSDNALPGHEEASGQGMEGSATSAASSVQANIARIIAHPETVEAEVEDTLRQLRERYEALQRRLEQTTTTSRPDTSNRKRRSIHPLVPNDDQSSSTSASASLQNEELIALSVLRGALPRGDASAGGSTLSEENMETESHHTESTDCESVSKKAKHD